MRIIEVGPRDGLQNEPAPVPTAEKVTFIHALRAAGLAEIEVTSFVSPKWVPQLSDAAEVCAELPASPGRYFGLVPNLRGLETMLTTALGGIAVFTAASDEFAQRNINMSVAESVDAFGEVIRQYRASRPSGWVRGYVSTAFECPYSGRIPPERARHVAELLAELGVNEVSLGDTIGVAVPREVRALAREFAGFSVPVVWHFHDTRGTALANVDAALESGVVAGFDASAAGLGGCPYAPGAGGNLATEDLIYFLERTGFATGVDLDALARASEPILARLGRPGLSKVQRVVLS